jgi:dTDP-glucose 4,6-dehydratase
VNIDCLSYGAVKQNLVNLERDARYRLVKGDITDRKLVEKLMRDVEVVVNFAAETHVDRSISDPRRFFQSNVEGTFTLLEAARKADVGKFMHISTDEVYGSAQEGLSFKESDRLRPSSPYSASKAAADMFVEAYHKTYGLHTVTMRCTNNFGPRQFPEKFIPRIVISALLGRKIPIYGNGMQVRDWTYVEDFCKAIDLATEKGESGAIYNVSSGNELPNVSITKLILKVLQKPTELIQLVEDRPGHDFRYSLDSTGIRNQLGWAPQHDFGEALRRTVGWYVSNEWWWRPLLTEKMLSPTPWKENW